MDIDKLYSPPKLKDLDLDKICRVCLTIGNKMRPLFGELTAVMLMDCTRIQVDNTDGWPDQICLDCYNQVTRYHIFKSRFLQCDSQLREYIQGLTVVVEGPIPESAIVHPIPLQRMHKRSPTILLPNTFFKQINKETQNKTNVDHIKRQISQPEDIPQMISKDNDQLSHGSNLNMTIRSIRDSHQIIETSIVTMQNGHPSIQHMNEQEDIDEFDVQLCEEILPDGNINDEISQVVDIGQDEEVLERKDANQIDKNIKLDKQHSIPMTTKICGIPVCPIDQVDGEFEDKDYQIIGKKAKRLEKFICNLCGMKFKLLNHLDLHKKSHTNLTNRSSQLLKMFDNRRRKTK